MEITMNQTTTRTSTRPCSTSGFGMPLSARGQHAAFGNGTVWIPTTGLTITGAEIHDRQDLAAKGHVSLDAVLPGNPAWSPPLC